MTYASELSHHDLFAILNYDRKINTLTLYTSFIGEYSVHVGRHGSIMQHDIIKPQKIFIKRGKPNTEELVDIFGQADESFHAIDPKNNPLKPNKKITHIEWFLDFEYENGKLINANLLPMLRIFKNINDAELFFIESMHTFLKTKKLIDAIDEYNKLMQRHGEINPEKILQIIGN